MNVKLSNNEIANSAEVELYFIFQKWDLSSRFSRGTEKLPNDPVFSNYFIYFDKYCQSITIVVIK